MKSLDEYLQDAAVAHGHLCAGQVLGVRMAMFGLSSLGLNNPQGKDRKRIVTFVEIDRCATDAVDGGNRLPSGKARSQVSRLGQDGGHVCGRLGNRKGAAGRCTRSHPRDASQAHVSHT